MKLRMVKNFIVVENETVEPPSTDRVAIARRRFGQPFAHEPGTRWKPRETLFLTQWMATRTRAK